MIRLITTARLRRILADRAEHTARTHEHIRNMRDLQAGADVLARRADHADTYATELETLVQAYAQDGVKARAQRDQARAIAVDLEQELAGQADVITGLRATIAARLASTRRAGAEHDTRIAALTADRDRALAQAETARAAAEAADIPIVDGLDPDDYVAAVKAVLADIAARKKAAADLRALRIADPEAACLAAEAMADWAARPEAL